MKGTNTHTDKRMTVYDPGIVYIYVRANVSVYLYLCGCIVNEKQKEEAGKNASTLFMLKIFA